MRNELRETCLRNDRGRNLMPDYGDILRFLAQNPPKLEAERRVHASLLELLGACMRDEDDGTDLIGDDAAMSQPDEKILDSLFH